MYVCRRCQANFKTGDGKAPTARLPGPGAKCNKCLADAAAASALGRLTLLRAVSGARPRTRF